MIKKLVSHLGEYKRAAILTPMFSALEAVMDILLPTIMAFIIDLGIEKGDMNAIVKYGLLTFAVAAIALLLGVLAGKYAAEASTGFAGNLRDAMYENIQHYSFSNIDKFSTAGLVTRLTTDLTNVQNAFQMCERMCVRAPVHLVFALFMAVMIGGPLSLIFVVAVVFLVAVLAGIMVPTFELTLPIGISFYTFQTMSYTIDVYRGLVPPQRNIVDFGAYVTLFPQLIAGPIVQYKTVAYDLEHRRESVSEASEGLQRLVIGLGKKVLIANQMGAIWEDIAAMSDPTAVTAWIGAIAYTFQIYFDFSGYSDMAIGLGHFFGFHFLENFNYPYESRSVTEFWRRWHISLSTWFREYVYIPLGGNRKGKGRQLLNIAIVWLLTGLWHGASWNFVLWGVYYAALLLLEKTFLLKWLDKAPRFVGHVYTCFCFVMGWVLFAITDLGALGAYVGHMFSGTFADSTTAYLLRCDWLLLVLGVIGCTSLPKRLWEKREQALSPALSDGLRTVWVVVVLLVSMAFLVGDSYNPFLYFRF